jgi:hypothetical protein
MAVLHAVAATGLAEFAVARGGEVGSARSVVLALLVGAAAVWSAVEAWLRVPDGGRTWLLAALVAGPVAGLLQVVGRAVLVDRTGVDALGSALTSGAAFTALLVLIPAGFGLLVGSRMRPPRSRATTRETAANTPQPRVGPTS